MHIKFTKNDNKAVKPKKAFPTDVGFDLVAIKKHKVFLNGSNDEKNTGVVVMYDTGISVTPPSGFYTEIVPRSSISKTGWILANSIGIVDPTYNGNLYIALMRISENAPELELPFCKCQLILRENFSCKMKKVSFLEQSERGDGGFGSTDK
jgi:dUTP pyrophosphatase